MSTPPTYQEGIFRVAENLVDLWTGFCFEQGAEGCEVLQEGPEEQTLKCYLVEPQDLREWIPRFQAEYPRANGPLELLSQKLCPVEDWRQTWHAFFEPQPIGRTLLVVPTWHQDPLPLERQVLWLEPGQAFGTGTHISTRLALETLELVLLQESTLPEALIDVGTGSGILGLAAARLGVPRVWACDNDPVVVPEARRNFALNQLESRFWGVLGTARVLTQPAPLVVSNMLLRELLSAVEDLARLTAPGGTLICSGLLVEQEQTLAAALAEFGLQICATTEADGWSALVFRESGAF